LACSGAVLLLAISSALQNRSHEGMSFAILELKFSSGTTYSSTQAAHKEKPAKTYRS
jgi:hypothetical protein